MTLLMVFEKLLTQPFQADLFRVMYQMLIKIEGSTQQSTMTLILANNLLGVGEMNSNTIMMVET